MNREAPSSIVATAGKIAMLAALSVGLLQAGVFASFLFTQLLLAPASEKSVFGAFLYHTQVDFAKTDRYVKLISAAERSYPGKTLDQIGENYSKPPSTSDGRILAALFFWRSTHDDYFGLCTAGCEDPNINERRENLSLSILSKDEKKILHDIEITLYPNIFYNYEIFGYFVIALWVFFVSILIVVTRFVFRRRTVKIIPL